MDIETRDAARRVLVEARALIIDENKWTKFTYIEEGRYCAVGAHDVAVSRLASKKIARVRQASFGALRDALPDQPFWAWIPEYNDHPETTHADIIALFDRAILSLTPPVETPAEAERELQHV